ncbi:MAG: threonine/serine dehydratase, partial [Chloroflexota bacterium]
RSYMSMIIGNATVNARSRIYPYIRKTFLEYSNYFSEMIGGEVWFKMENQQHTGSFKARGAVNKIMNLTDSLSRSNEVYNGVVTASTGNHGAAVGYALSQFGLNGMVFVPENASPSKLKNISQYGVDIIKHGQDGVETENYARQYADENGYVYISPYNDLDVIGGQGTIGIELTAELEKPADHIFVALGGGGLISGVSGFLKTEWPKINVIGCSPVNSMVMIKSVRAKKILDIPSLPTISDGTAGGVEKGAITFKFISKLVDEFETVTEEEIKNAMRLFMDVHHQMIEGAAGVAVASLIKQRERLAGKRVVAIICGGNIDLQILKGIL